MVCFYWKGTSVMPRHCFKIQKIIMGRIIAQRRAEKTLRRINRVKFERRIIRGITPRVDANANTRFKSFAAAVRNRRRY